MTWWRGQMQIHPIKLLKMVQSKSLIFPWKMHGDFPSFLYVDHVDNMDI